MKSKNKVKILVPLSTAGFLISLAVIVFCLFVLNPTKLGPGGVTFWFLTFFLMITSFITLVFYAILRNRAKYAESKDSCFYRSAISGFILGASLTVLLALSSLRSLSWRDFLLFVAAVIVIEVFFRTRRVAGA